MKTMQQTMQDCGQISKMIDIPGFAAKPTPPGPAALQISVPSCPHCDPLQSALILAFEKLCSAQITIDGAILLGKEAAERSAVRIGTYEGLHNIFVKHGMPFENGYGIPGEYQKIFPRHDGHDGLLRGMHKKAAREAMGLHELEEQSGDGNDSTGMDESEESIPARFQPRDSDESNEADSTYHEGSPEDEDWELNPDDQNHSGEASNMDAAGSSDSDAAGGSDPDASGSTDPDATV